MLLLKTIGRKIHFWKIDTLNRLIFFIIIIIDSFIFFVYALENEKIILEILKNILVFEVILNQKFRKRSEYGKWKLKRFPETIRQCEQYLTPLAWELKCQINRVLIRAFLVSLCNYFEISTFPVETFHFKFPGNISQNQLRI